MPTLHLGDKSRHFKQLNILHRHRIARRNDPLSAYQSGPHRITLSQLHEILTQEWSILNLHRRFLQSRASYVEFIPKSDVMEKLLSALLAYEKCLTHQAFYNPQGVVKYDLREFEERLFGAVTALHSLGSTSSAGTPSSPSSELPLKIPAVRFGVMRGPVGTGWKCTREGETWRANMKILLDPGKGKLRMKEWEYEAVGLLVDGLISVTFVDGEGEDARQLALDETLPRDVLDHFAVVEVEKMDEGVVFDMDVLGGETGLSFRLKKSWSEGGVVEIEGDAGDGAAAVVYEQRAPICLSLHSRGSLD
jgi:hypothetical protein